MLCVRHPLNDATSLAIFRYVKQDVERHMFPHRYYMGIGQKNQAAAQTPDTQEIVSPNPSGSTNAHIMALRRRLRLVQYERAPVMGDAIGAGNDI